MDLAIGRFTTVDPMAEKYYSISPYAYVGNNPMRKIDPTGKFWEEVKEAEELKKNINRKINSLTRDRDNIQAKLDAGGLSDKKISRYNDRITETNQRITNLNKSIQDIDQLGADQNNMYAFSHISGGKHKVRSSNGKVLIETSSDAFSIHEITHVRQSLDAGGLEFSSNGELLNSGKKIGDVAKMEIDAYQMQYSYDQSFPGSTKGNGLNGIDVHSVGGIMENGKHVYPLIHKHSMDIKKNDKIKQKILKNNQL